MIYTSYFAKYRGDKGVSIARKQPKSKTSYPEIVELMPPSKLLWKYKNDEISEEEFVQEYRRQVLKRLDPEKVGRDLEGKVLLCWEKPENFCHRHIVADWLEENGFEVKEVGQMSFTLDMPERPTSGSCLYCEFGKLDCEHTPIQLTCMNKTSKNYKKKTKFPTKRTCGKWRYKF